MHRDFKPLFANQMCAEIFGYSNPEEILELESIQEVFWAPEEQDRIKDYKTRRMEGDEVPNIIEFHGMHKDGSLFWFESHVTTIDWQGEKAIQAAVIDITERKQVEEALQEKNKSISLMENIAAAANESKNIEETIKTCLDMVCSYTGWPIGHYYAPANDGTGGLVPSCI
ncbi:MAG: PAS domain S-box protein, partial [Pseudomonadales bacterium]